MSGTGTQASFDLSGRVAVITGGAGILGQHFCRGVASAGASVAVVDVDVAKARTLASDIQHNIGVRAIGVHCDVSSPSSVVEMVDTVCHEFGQINLLHNNAASKSDNLEAFFAPFENYSLNEWRKIMAVNIDGMFLVAQAVGKKMIEQGTGGSIVQTASIYGVMAPDQRIYEGSNYLGLQINTPAVYAASKAAVIGLSQYLATYWAKHGIRVNTLTPGGVESGQNDEFKQRYSARVPMGRMAVPTEMVGALLYLLSDASSYATGQNIIIDGGLSAW